MNLIDKLNDVRKYHFSISHNHDHILENSLPSWVFHKILSCISIPVNTVEFVFSVTAFIASACTIGTAKVALYALTLGNFKLPISTGFEVLADHGLQGFIGLFGNIYEIGYDVYDLAYQATKLPRFIAEKLNLEGFFQALMLKIQSVVDTCLIEINKFLAKFSDRLSVSINVALASEKPVVTGTPYPLNKLNNLCRNQHPFLSNDSRSFEGIFKHYAYSILNIPCNAVTAVAALIASLALSTAFVVKATIHATTNIDIEVPTYAGQAIEILEITSANAAVDTAFCVTDGFITIYKVSDAIGILKVMATAKDILFYIPVAIFG
jgi:hypothetical protein